MSNRNLRRKNMGNKKKGLIGLAAMCVFSGAVILGSNAVTDWIDNRPLLSETQNKPIGLIDGTYTAEEAEFDGSGYKGIVTMTVKDGSITELNWDNIDKEGNKKSQLSLDGKYVMTEDGPIWKEQAEALAKYVVEHQSIEGLQVNEEGKTDAVSGVSISINGFISLVEDCLEQASGKVKTNGSLTDGTYTAEEAEFDGSGYKGIVTMTVKDGSITELNWDNIDKEGNKKSQLSLDGKYVMTEDGPIWKEQAEALAKYVVEHQSIEGLQVNEEGKTDAVSGVSIGINGFISLVEDCLEQASGKVKTNASLTDGTYTAEEADFDGSGYKGIVTMTVKDGSITELNWDNIDKEGNKKSQLSLDGSYVMTEDGPIWKEQAEALAKYVVEHQSIEGLQVNEEGKTDAVSGVSIGINGFISLVEDCLEQASGKVKANENLIDGTYTAEEADFDGSGYKGIVTMTVKDGSITELNWDNIDKEGNKKSQLSLDGSYVMTEDGPIWKEQAEALAKYVVDNQSIEGLQVNEEGKTDAVSGVSIGINGFISLVEDCLEQASGKVKTNASLTDGTYTAEEANFDGSGYKGIVTMTVKDGSITELNWDNIDKEGNKKSQLSLDGKYVMTEDGPIWKEQAEALAKYVVEHQSIESLQVNEEGKTDAVSGVSIGINGFISLVEDCLAQAQ